MTSDSTNELIEEEGEVGTDEEEEAECCTNAFARGLIITVLVLLLIGMLVLAIMIKPEIKKSEKDEMHSPSMMLPLPLIY